MEERETNFSLEESYVGNLNRTEDESTVGVPPGVDVVFVLLTSLILGILILSTIIGNVFVIGAILLDRHLQSVANYLILSLAVADLLVALLVMPLGAVYEIRKTWSLGPVLCDMWTCSDVLCCTASILHLLAIAIDRYWAVTHAHYIHSRNTTNISLMISLVWIVSIVVSLAPLLGWKDDSWSERVEAGECMVSQDISYQIFATSATFFVPLVLILILYWRIFLTARSRIRRRMAQKAGNSNSTQAAGRNTRVGLQSDRARMSSALKTKVVITEQSVQQETTSFTSTVKTFVVADENKTAEHSTSDSADHSASPKLGCERHQNGRSQRSDIACQTENSRLLIAAEQKPRRKKEKKHVSLEAKREKKAAKTLAIVTGAFILCWLPFFVMALVTPLCATCVNDRIFSVFLWLGYFNSTLNPIIYTVFSPEFRQAFKKLLCGRNMQENYRPRHLQ